MKALSGPLSEVHAFSRAEDRRTDGLWGVLGEFSSAGAGRKPLAPLCHPVCLERVEGSVPVYDGFLSHRSLDFYEALNKGQVHPQGSAAPRSLLTHLQIVYQFQILAIVCRCEGIGHSVELFLSSL